MASKRESERAQAPRESNLSYKLPPIVESICSGWVGAVGSGATVSSLLAAVEASLVAFFRDEKNYYSPQPKMQEAIVALTLAGMLLSISATISALMLVDGFGEIPFRASCMPTHATHPVERTETDEGGILRLFGARRTTLWLVVHWQICLILAALCAIIAIIMYSAMQGTMTLVITSIAVLTALPPVLWIFEPS